MAVSVLLFNGVISFFLLCLSGLRDSYLEDAVREACLCLVRKDLGRHVEASRKGPVGAFDHAVARTMLEEAVSAEG